MQITVPNLEKWALAPSWSCVKMEPWPPMLTKNLVPNLEALMSFCWLLPCWKHPWTHHFSIFHHFFTVFLHLSPFLQSFLPSFLIHHLFMVSPHFHAFSNIFYMFLPFFLVFPHLSSEIFQVDLFFSRARCFGLRQPGAVPRAGPGRAAQRDVGRRAAARVLHRGGRGARWGAEQCWAVLRGEGWCLASNVYTSRTGSNRHFSGSKATNYGKSPFSMGKSTINVPFSIANC